MPFPLPPHPPVARFQVYNSTRTVADRVAVPVEMAMPPAVTQPEETQPEAMPRVVILVERLAERLAAAQPAARPAAATPPAETALAAMRVPVETRLAATVSVATPVAT